MLGCCSALDAFWHQGHEPLVCVQAPPVLKLLFGSLRGYAGEINPAAALDAVASTAPLARGQDRHLGSPV